MSTGQAEPEILPYNDAFLIFSEMTEWFYGKSRMSAKKCTKS